MVRMGVWQIDFFVIIHGGFIVLSTKDLHGFTNIKNIFPLTCLYNNS